MAKKEDIGNYAVLKIEDYGDFSFDTEELNVEQLMKKGFTKKHAEDLVRKHKIDKLFDAYPK